MKPKVDLSPLNVALALLLFLLLLNGASLPDLSHPIPINLNNPNVSSDLEMRLSGTKNIESVCIPTAVRQQAHYGHLPYAEYKTQPLVYVGSYYERSEFLAPEASQAFLMMQREAASKGIQITPISGFRSISDQAYLFQRQVQRQGSAKAAAKLSAPPGYSEHHTGYAIDIGDRAFPEFDLKTRFTETPAYQWLSKHAEFYGFELSFPPNNSQGISFEPWHWRYSQSCN